MQIKFKTLKIFVIYVLVTSFTFTGLTFDQNLIDAGVAVYSGRATNYQKGIVFAENKSINHARLYDVISDEVYQVCQYFFQIKSDKISRKAADDARLVYKKQISSSPMCYNPGTDTDIIVSPRRWRMTLRKIKKVRKFYSNGVEKYLKYLGYKHKKGIDWASKHDVDFLPSHEYTRSENFLEICQWINKKGGTAYESIIAVKVECLIRSGNCGQITLVDASIYYLEMERLIKCVTDKLKTISANLDDIEDIGPNEKQAILIKLSLQIDKYILRKDLINVAIQRITSPCDYETSFSMDASELSSARTPESGRVALRSCSALPTIPEAEDSPSLRGSYSAPSIIPEHRLLPRDSLSPLPTIPEGSPSSRGSSLDLSDVEGEESQSVMLDWGEL